MQEIRCPKCGEVFQVDDSGYDQIAQQVRDREFEKELDRRKKDLDAKREQELEIIRLQEEKEHTASITQKDAEISEKDQKQNCRPNLTPVKRQKNLLLQRQLNRRTWNYLKK